MATLVGTQKEFASVIKALIELDYDAIEAYKVAAAKLENKEYSALMLEFQKDHERHIEELTAILKKRSEEAPSGPDNKQWLTKGKVFLATVIGDKGVLMAMSDNENDTNTAYTRTFEHQDIWGDAKEIIRKGKEDEKRHKDTLEKVLSTL